MLAEHRESSRYGKKKWPISSSPRWQGFVYSFRSFLLHLFYCSASVTLKWPLWCLSIRARATWAGLSSRREVLWLWKTVCCWAISLVFLPDRHFLSLKTTLLSLSFSFWNRLTHCEEIKTFVYNFSLSPVVVLVVEIYLYFIIIILFIGSWAQDSNREFHLPKAGWTLSYTHFLCSAFFFQLHIFLTCSMLVAFCFIYPQPISCASPIWSFHGHWMVTIELFIFVNVTRPNCHNEVKWMCFLHRMPHEDEWMNLACSNKRWIEWKQRKWRSELRIMLCWMEKINRKDKDKLTMV